MRNIMWALITAINVANMAYAVKAGNLPLQVGSGAMITLALVLLVSGDE